MCSMTPQLEYSENARRAFAVVAILAWFGMGLNLLLTVFNVYPSLNTDPTALGFNPDGIAGVIGRVLDFFTYFTIWSNILVAIVMTMLWRRTPLPTFVVRVLRLDSLVMITVTALVFIALLAPDVQLQGLEYVTNTIEHYLVPLLVIVTWLIWGPRRWIRLVDIPAALIIPIVWAIWALLRGAVINAYPYGFLNVAVHGLGTVIITIVEIAVFGMVLGLIFFLVDLAISKLRS